MSPELNFSGPSSLKLGSLSIISRYLSSSTKRRGILLAVFDI
jgi:hypothetical protein